MTKQQAVKIVKQTALIAPSKMDALASALMLGTKKWESAYKKECKDRGWQCSPRLRKQVRELIAS